MSKRIQTYDDLQEEKKRLENLLASKKLEIREDWQGVKHHLKPVTNVFGFIGKLTHRDRSNPLLNFGIDMAGNVLLKKFILARADWVTRLLLPIFVKNYSSNVLGEKGKGFFGKLRRAFQKEKQYHYAHGQAPDVPPTGPIDPTRTATSPEETPVTPV